MDETRKAELILILISAIWGSTFPVMKLGIEDYPPITFVAFRFLIASLLMLIFLRKDIKTSQALPGLLVGLSLFLGFSFQVVGLKYTTSSNSAFITSLYMVFTPFVAILLLKTRVKLIDWVALGLALLGTYLISNVGNFNYGDMLTVLAALSFAFQIVLVEYFGNLGIGLAFWQVFWNSMFSLAYAAIFEGLPMPREGSTLFAIIYTAIMATAIAFAVQVKYQPKIDSHRAAIIYSAEPVFGHFFSFLILGEVLSWKGYIGALLILIAVWLEISRENLISD
ncbi:DMT family transporter [Pyrococcus abyssi]|uniref:Membrane protein, putative n=1 Tax=Pyrococcus abyssi (strain GE5 / Orsay) TaxID=272844 RepID=Q9UYQ7_PYRAB|nr:DMT family transporter [Pyrococcus abyssi]CAB50355.1 Membrane protein, putative [Pyrococcus abyssi GE5]CCE70896.1 TPA: hypothetical protein PAB2381 [Pyrococcus abyssi GE5]